MAELINMPPSWTGEGDVPESKWAVVYRDEREPSLPEYVCIVWESRREGGKSIRENIATLCSFASASESACKAVKAARKWCGLHGIQSENVYYWGVVRRN
ncbi:hypothetical protein EBZ39_15390 [bacterium]|nr:hypothetical protein [bacterium]